MYDRTSVTADTLELLIHNQQALRAGLEELSLWIKRQGETTAHENVLSIPAILDMNADAISTGIEYLRR